MALLLIVIVVFVIVVLVYLYRSQAIHGPVINFLIAALLLFVVLSLGYVYLNSDVDISNLDGWVELSKSYFHWLGALLKNTGNIAGYAVKQEWGINSTNITR